MAKVRYIGEERQVETFHHLFNRDKWRGEKGEDKHDLSPHELAILNLNPHFEVTGLDADKDDAAKQAEAAKPVEQRGDDKAAAGSNLDGDHNDARG